MITAGRGRAPLFVVYISDREQNVASIKALPLSRFPLPLPNAMGSLHVSNLPVELLDLVC